jgi:hypothetical protein
MVDLKQYLFASALPGETGGQFADRYSVPFPHLAESGVRAPTDQLGDRLITLRWPIVLADDSETPLAKAFLNHQTALVASLASGLHSTAKAQVRDLEWDFAAFGTVVVFTVVDNAFVLMTSEGIGAVERPATAGDAETGLTQAINRLCRTLERALTEHRAG